MMFEQSEAICAPSAQHTVHKGHLTGFLFSFSFASFVSLSSVVAAGLKAGLEVFSNTQVMNRTKFLTLSFAAREIISCGTGFCNFLPVLAQILLSGLNKANRRYD